MIEHEELGIKIAENENEKFWNEILENTKKDIEGLEKMLKFQKAIQDLANSKLKDDEKEG